MSDGLNKIFKNGREILSDFSYCLPPTRIDLVDFYVIQRKDKDSDNWVLFINSIKNDIKIKKTEVVDGVIKANNIKELIYIITTNGGSLEHKIRGPLIEYLKDRTKYCPDCKWQEIHNLKREFDSAKIIGPDKEKMKLTIRGKKLWLVPIFE